MKICHIIGRKNHGKTTLIVDLVRELTRRHIKVGTIKHTCHSHTLDTPGKDSYRHQTAGAAPASIVTKDMLAVYVPYESDGHALDRLSSLFADCDLVMVEGNPDWPGVKLEVWRETLGSGPMALEQDNISAVITDDPIDTSIPVWSRDDLDKLADQVQEIMHISDTNAWISQPKVTRGYQS